MSDPTVEAHLRRICAEDEAIAEEGITATEENGVWVLSGQVASPHRRALIEERLTAELAGVPIRNEITVTATRPPEAAEEIG